MRYGRWTRPYFRRRKLRRRRDGRARVLRVQQRISAEVAPEDSVVQVNITDDLQAQHILVEIGRRTSDAPAAPLSRPRLGRHEHTTGIGRARRRYPFPHRAGSLRIHHARHVRILVDAKQALDLVPCPRRQCQPLSGTYRAAVPPLRSLPHEHGRHSLQRAHTGVVPDVGQSRGPLPRAVGLLGYRARCLFFHGGHGGHC
mmetsp:Transcript_10583/g.26062  ORF Transcript_10583/g.26062 Transcript_10583/m.26062 type:complete len:200 (+) Transcript_10583:1119-1718(+)